MGYHRHTAREDVFTDPGERDITAHVNFTALRERGEVLGLATERFETLAQMHPTVQATELLAVLQSDVDCLQSLSEIGELLLELLALFVAAPTLLGGEMHLERQQYAVAIHGCWRL
jgi:SAM-dependent MidA family methyltransferase